MANKEDISAMTLPRVLVVSRRSIRKNKFVDFVGEYHLDLLVTNGAIPVIVPRVAGILNNLDSFEPIHGVLLCEGEDIDPSFHSTTTTPNSSLSQSDLDEIHHLHQSDTNADHNKDSIELALTNLCFRRSIPILGICRGSQLLNVACGGTLFLDLQKQLSNGDVPVVHVDYGNYDGHRHEVRVVEGTPLESWFMESLVDGEIMVNSYHHQGVKKLAERFVPMAFAMDELVEGFYDPHCYNPEEGKFVVGLQFHPERLRRSYSEEFDYPGCKSVYQEFVKAVVAYQKKLNSAGSVPKSVMLDQEIEKKRKINMIIRSFFVTRNTYVARLGTPASKAIGFEAGADFLELNVGLCFQQEKRLKQMGATVRDGCSFLRGLWLNKVRETLARNVMGKMSIEQLSELVSRLLISHDGAD